MIIIINGQYFASAYHEILSKPNRIRIPLIRPDWGERNAYAKYEITTIDIKNGISIMVW